MTYAVAYFAALLFLEHNQHSLDAEPFGRESETSFTLIGLCFFP